MSEEELVRQLASEMRILEGSVNALQSRLEFVRAAIGEVTMAHSTIEGLKKTENGDTTLVPVGGGTYVMMKIADSKKLIMGIGAGVAMEKDVDVSIEELKGRLQELEKARTAVQQQLEQTLGRYQQDRDAVEELLKRRNSAPTKPQR
jgi:prefoldin alpha subunit